MHKFKVGDRVLIRKDLVSGRVYHNCFFNGRDGMSQYRGRNTHIEDIRPDGMFQLHKCGHWEWSDEMLISLSKGKLDLSHIKKFGVAVFIDSLNEKQKRRKSRKD
jgi:hypothetical protein